MKNTLDFGFRPGENPRKNALALQEAVKGGGEIYIIEPGIYDIDQTIVLESHTTLTFGEGVYLRRVQAEDQILGYTFINKGAYTHQYDSDITILGMQLMCNGVDTNGKAENAIPGLRGQLSFFYVKNLTIRDFKCMDLLAYGFCIQICTFENIIVENVHIEGRKDGVHLGRGKNFVIRHGIFRTFDDPIALNAHDYSTANPQLGWIENGIIEDCYDLDEDTTTGYFCRILAGSWCDWREGMEVQHSDAVVHNGRLYRVVEKPDETIYRSVTPPTHQWGSAVYDGINWVMVQEDACYNCGCRNIYFKDIHLCKHRYVALSIHFDNDKYSRSVYPGSEMPVQENIIFENVYAENEIDLILSTVTPAKGIVFRNSEFKNSKFLFRSLPREGLEYPASDVRFEGVSFKLPQPAVIKCAPNRSVEARFSACTCVASEFKVDTTGDVQITQYDVKYNTK